MKQVWPEQSAPRTDCPNYYIHTSKKSPVKSSCYDCKYKEACKKGVCMSKQAVSNKEI